MALTPVTSPEGRAYEWDGDVYPSVTTIIAKIPKPALTNWLIGNVATYAAENAEAITQMDGVEARVAAIKAGGKHTNTGARDRGSRVHHNLEQYLLNDRSDEAAIADLDPEDLPWILAGTQFCDDHIDKVLYPEATVFNETYRYAGTADIFCTLKDGRTAVLDWKTGKRVYPDVALQLTAYAQGDYLVTDDLEKHDVPAVDCGIVVRLTGSGTYIAKEIDTASKRNFRTFIALRTITLWESLPNGDILSDYAKGKVK